MKTLILSAALLSNCILNAQSENKQNETKQTRVRIKKIENINGVEKVTDSTYTINGPVQINGLSENNVLETKDGDKERKTVIITDHIGGDEASSVNKEDLNDEQIQKALKAAGVDDQVLKADKMLVVKVKSDSANNNGACKQTKVIIISTAKVSELTGAETKLLCTKTASCDNKLSIDKLNFYPNPNTGKFNLSFDLNEKGNTTVSIMSVDGKKIYSESLTDFTGHYSKEIDISENPKGIYFVKIEQGKHAQLKKLVLE
jgi:hypothetical protein